MDVSMENFDEKIQEKMAKELCLSVFQTIAGLFELGCQIKVDKANRMVTVTGYDTLNESYGLEEDETLRERTYCIEYEEEEDGSWESEDLASVLECMAKDSKKLGVETDY